MSSPKKNPRGKATSEKKAEKTDSSNPVWIRDPRGVRPIAIHSKKDKTTFVLSHNEIYKLNGRSITFAQPNNISLSLEISNRAYDTAAEMFLKQIKPKLNAQEVEFAPTEIASLFDYFQQLQVSLIFIYTAVEAFANVAIPADYELVRVNSKKVKEVWTKESIERWLSTSEKIGDIVPAILKVKSPKSEPFWSKFKELERLRDEIVHQKTTQDQSNVSSRFLSAFFDKQIFDTIRSGFLVIDHFCSQSEHPHVYFPLGMGSPKMVPLVVDDFSKHFRHADEVKKK